VAAVSPFTCGLDNAAMIHSRSIQPAMGSCARLPQYRLPTTFELSETTTETSSIGSSGDSDGWAGADSSGLRDTEGLRRFMGVYDYPLIYPDSDGANYDPSCGCFQSARAPLQRTLPIGPSWERPAMSAPVGTHQAELEQLRKLEAKVDEDH
jgi:hypothetical protein